MHEADERRGLQERDRATRPCAGVGVASSAGSLVAERAGIAQIRQQVPGVDDAHDRCGLRTRDEVQVQHVDVDVGIDDDALDLAPVAQQRHGDGAVGCRCRPAPARADPQQAATAGVGETGGVAAALGCAQSGDDQGGGGHDDPALGLTDGSHHSSVLLISILNKESS